MSKQSRKWKKHPPLRLILGADAIERVRAKLAQVREDLEIWMSTSVSMAYAAPAEQRSVAKTGIVGEGA